MLHQLHQLHELLVPRQDGGPPPMPPRSPEYLAENIAPQLMAVEGPLFALSMTAILMRFCVRGFMLKTFGWDDAMMAVAACISITTLALFLKIIDMGLGLHAEAFPLVNIFPFFKVMYFYSILIIFAYSFIKLSIGFFLLRLADRTRWRPFLIGMLIFIAMFTIGSTFAIIFQCSPVAAGYDYTLRPPLGTAKCYDPTIFKNVGVFNSSINIATDLIFALIPIPMVWRLQVTVRTRIGLGIILSLGLFASAVAIYKTPMQANFFKETDWSGHGAWYYIWQQVEMHIGIIAACLPTIKPLFANFSSSIRTLTKGRSTNSLGPSKSGISTPFKSSGYVKQSEHHSRGQDDFALEEFGERRRGRDLYGEDVGLGKEGGEWRVEGGGGSETGSEVGGGRRSVARGMTIVRTTEVNVSR
ncbi:hypothetical protein T440DRAFT_513858 [Plenodomus tracheiphilus IPT5]|uniref:Rhodopsin domain-containing protein n=1 Tax=Plenodomus tracheiphilus IPT5 TaxID=1408161 RepID=A0A6A7BLT6_9PLEO|nr:hypothetical protein T440DRAFT_513858 [Plenodomus tracheiphilus IPT5]